MSQQRQIPELNKEDPESLYNWIAYKVSSPEFRNPLKNYIDENCSTFVDIDENSFEQGQLYKEINLLIENLLKDVLEEGQITQEDFLKAAERGMEDKKYKKYFNQIINFGDYNFFKSVMIKRNYQIMKMAEQQMNQQEQEPEQQENTPENKNEGAGENEIPEADRKIIAEMLENEQNELNEAIKQSLIDEEEKRKIAIIEEEEIKRAIKKSLELSKNQPKKEEPKKEEPKKETPKKEEPKKEEPKKIVPNIISSNIGFQVSGTKKPEEEKPVQPNPSTNKGFQFQVDSKTEDFGIINESKNKLNNSSMPAPVPPVVKKKEKKKEPAKNFENEFEVDTQKNFVNTKTGDEKEKENKIKEEEKPEKQERITREFVNIFEEKKLTLAPLVNKVNKPPTLTEDLKKSGKEGVKKDIERMQKKIEIKSEPAKDIIKNSIQQNNNTNQDFMEDADIGGLLIDDDDEEEIVVNDKRDNSKATNIHFGKIAIPKNFNDKIPEYDKEKQEQLKEYRDMVLKKMSEVREQQINNK